MNFPLMLIVAAYGYIAYAAFVILRWLYRLSPLHPLYRFPWASRYAVMSEWYEFYWNVIRDGQFVFKCKEWHDKHGKKLTILIQERFLLGRNCYPSQLA